MTASSRILVNTIAGYSRTLLGMALGLYSSRWILHSLGPVDFGLFSVVGGLIVFLMFFQGVLSSSVARFYSLAIGKGAIDATKAWFNTAFLVHATLPFLLMFIGAPVGEWFVRHCLNIPPERLATAVWVFRLSVVSAVFTIGATPFVAMFNAKQCIAEVSLWSIMGSLITFGLAFFLTKYEGDALLVYSAGLVTITVLTLFCQIARALVKFKECRVSLALMFDLKRIKTILSYAGWSLFGSLGHILRGNGIAILLNLYFPPAHYKDVNASYSVASTIGTHTQSLSVALMNALAPEITATEGRGDRAKVVDYALRASKFGVMLVAVFAIPLILEIDYILEIWLETPPSMAAALSVLTIVVFLIDKVTFGHLVAISAVGKIAGYQLTVGVTMILTLPLAWLFLHLGGSAILVGWAMVATMSLCSMGRLLWAKHLVGVSILRWVKEVLVPVGMTFCACFFIGQAIKNLFGDPRWDRCISVCAGTFVTWSVCLWGFVFTKVERSVFISKASRMIKGTAHDPRNS